MSLGSMPAKIGVPAADLDECTIMEHEMLLQSYREKRCQCVQCHGRIDSWTTSYPLPCLHVLCSSACLEINKSNPADDKSEAMASYCCPSCCVIVEAWKLPTWRALGRSIYAKERYLDCTHCTRQVGAIYWCSRCRDSLCEICKDGHPLLVRTSKHLVTLLDPVGKIDLENDRVFCPKHKGKSETFCITCSKILCSLPKCKRSHLNHERKNTKELIEEFRRKTEMVNLKMRKFLIEADPMMVEINDEIQKIVDRDANSELLRLFRTEFVRILDFVARCEMLVRRRLKLASLSKVKTLNMKSFTIRSTKLQVNQFLNSIGDTSGMSGKEIVRHLNILQPRLAQIEDTMNMIVDDSEAEEEKEPNDDLESDSNEEDGSPSRSEPIAQNTALFLTSLQELSGRLDKVTSAMTNDEIPSLEVQRRNETRTERRSGQLQYTSPLPTEGTEADTKKSFERSTILLHGPSRNNYQNDGEEVEPEGDRIAMDTEDQPGSESTSSEVAAVPDTPKKPKRKTRGPSCKSLTPPLPVKRSTRSRSTTRRSDTFTYDSDRPSTRKRSLINDSSDSESRCKIPGRKYSSPLRNRSPSPSPARSSSNSSSGFAKRRSVTETKSPKKLSKEEVNELVDFANRKKKVKSKKRGYTETEEDEVEVVKPPKGKPGRKKSLVQTATAGTSTTTDTIETVISAALSSEISVQPKLKKKSPGRPKSIKRLEVDAEDEDRPPTLVPITDVHPAESSRKSIHTPLPVVVPSILSTQMKINMDFDDPNEDYCAVCLDGGDELLICCDYCPKVFHTKCHLPAMNGVPKDDWQCMFCKKREDLPDVDWEVSVEEAKKLAKKNLEVFSELPQGKFLQACKFLSELYNTKEYAVLIVHFNAHYRERREEPVPNLDLIRKRLTLGEPRPYQSSEKIIFMLKRMFDDANQFYKWNMEVIKYLQVLEDKFKKNLSIFYPNYVIVTGRTLPLVDSLASLRESVEIEKESEVNEYVEESEANKEDDDKDTENVEQIEVDVNNQGEKGKETGKEGEARKSESPSPSGRDSSTATSVQIEEAVADEVMKMNDVQEENELI